MQIIFKYDDLLFSLFPEAKKFGNDQNILLKEIKNYFSTGPFQPIVKLQDEIIIVEIDEPIIIRHEKDYQKVVELCNKGKFTLAKPILQKLIKENPTVSEYHRILGQILSEEDNQDEAVDKLIDALRWNPDNTSALLMMGNIFAKHRNDIATATKYYDQSLAADPSNYVTLNNIGANLLKLERFEEGRRYLEIANEIKPDYPNTHYNLALYYKTIRDNLNAFDYASSGLKSTGSKDPFEKHLIDLIFVVSNSYLKEFDAALLVDLYVDDLEERGKKKIKKEIDSSISTAAKIEFAENYNREFHLIRYKNTNPSYNHLILHELVHLDLILQAREFEANTNKLFSVRAEHKNRFITNHEEDFNKLKRVNFTEDIIKNFAESLFTGMNNQIYNAPLDLFIEDFLFNKFPKLRPIQFLSLEALLKEGIKAVTAKEKKLIPSDILNASTVLNLVSAYQLISLYGLDYTALFNALNEQYRLAKRFFEDYELNKNNHNPGDEYNFVERWAKELKLNEYFDFISERDYHNSTYLDDKLNEIKDDPLGLDKPLPDDALKQPLSYSSSPAGKMAVTMYCLDALQHFKDKTPKQIKDIAYEIALLGRHGLDPHDADKKLHLASIPNKEFTSLQLLAFMFVAWQTFEPGADLNLDFQQEYILAKQMFEKKNK